MKILLVKPPLNHNLLTTSLYEPLELEYLAAAVNTHDVRILDMRVDRNLQRELNIFKPDLIGITAYTCDYNTVVSLLKEIRKFSNQINTVVGGHHATFMPEDFAFPFVNAVFLGYADSTFPLYIDALGKPDSLNDIPNLALVNGDKMSFTRRDNSAPGLDNLPFPARGLTSKYRQHYHDPVRNRMTLLMTSRGCLYRCNFCACWKLMDGKYSARTPQSITEELKSLPDESEIVYFSDDNTFSSPDRMWKLCEMIKSNNIHKKLQMYARADTIVKNKSLFEEMAHSGLKFITVGLESFNDRDLGYYGKRTSIAINNQAIEILKSCGIYILSHFIIRPEYTEKDFNELFKYVCDRNLFRPAYPVLTPLPGTRLYDETLSAFTINNYDFFDFTHSILPTKLETKEFYRQLTKLYVGSFSLSRLAIHRFCRLFSLRKERYYTDNTDGITVWRLVLMAYHGISLYFKMRFSYLRWKDIPVNI